ncbi:MAG: bi-domain-containing oxidoreductase [Bacillota bacterium]
MKQIIQDLKTGKVEVKSVPCPRLKDGHLLIQTAASVLSSGTERMLIEFGKSNIINKARQQPDKVIQVIDKVKTDGLIPTIETIKNKLDQPLPLGNSNVGIVLGIGRGVDGFTAGDRVVSNGSHAEVVCVPKNLCVKVPDNVNDEEAAFTVLGAISLEGIRLAQPTLGETFAIFGLGLIGQLVLQLLRAHGCRVLGIDMDAHKLELARKYGAETVDISNGEDPILLGMDFSRLKGIDGVIITASSKSSEIVHQAAQMSRKRGRIILIGVTGLELSRADFYEKEISFQVSCSYGPGRYDKDYEEKGHDYPYGYVRWTEQRNFEAVLDMISDGFLDVSGLISRRFSFDNAQQAYNSLSNDRSSLGIVLEYPLNKNIRENDKLNRTIYYNEKDMLIQNKGKQNPVVSIVGAGNFTSQVLLPLLKKYDVRLKSIVSNNGISGVHLGQKYGFEITTTDATEVLNDREVEVVFITTPHNTHASYVLEALNAGKHVFVEKPLCLDFEEIDKIALAQQENLEQIVMVGFNRRFSPHIIKLKKLLDSLRQPKSIIITVNAGSIPEGHWVHDPLIGGGRLIGEACHFIDLLRYIIGSTMIDVQCSNMGKNVGVQIIDDKATITLTFADGSFGTVHYFANGHKSFPKERIEVFCGKRILALDNFRILKGYGWPGFKSMRLLRQDKGHSSEIEAFLEAVKMGHPSPIPFHEIEEVTRFTIKAANIIRKQFN